MWCSAHTSVRARQREDHVNELLQTTLDGLLDGSAYALVGLGLALSFGTLRRLNLAYGAGAMLAAYVGAWLHQKHQMPMGLVAAAVVATAVLVGLYVERLCFAESSRGSSGAALDAHAARAALPVAGHDGREVVALAATFAVWMQLEQLAVNLLPRHLNPFPSFAASAQWDIAGLVLRPDRAALALLAIVLTLMLSAYLGRTRGGLAWRAVSDRRVAAHLVGIPVAAVQRLAFAAACALSGVAAFAVLAIDGQVTPMFGMWVLVKGLVAAMLGGLGSIGGVLVGGWVLGLVEAHAQGLFGALGREFSTWAVLLAVLVWRGGVHRAA
jgi:branched-chain amino acid transport system permease protein